MIKVLHKALNILEYISGFPEGQTLTAIVNAIGEKNTTTSNIIHVLAERNYLERCSNGWKLGVSPYLVTGSLKDYDKALCVLAEPILQELAVETETTAVLSVWRGYDKYVLLRATDNSQITVNYHYPKETRVYRTSTGIILLSEQPKEVIYRYIEKHGIPENADPSQEEVEMFIEQLSVDRKQGYYVRYGEQVFEVAASLHDQSGQSHTAVGLYMPRFRMSDQQLLVDKLLEATKKLEMRLKDNGVNGLLLKI